MDLDLSAASALSAGSSPGAARDSRLARTAEEFEALFVAQMLAPMFETIKTDGPFGGGGNERMYRSLMVQEYGKAIAAAGGIGIADSVQREMLRLQEAQA